MHMNGAGSMGWKLLMFRKRLKYDQIDSRVNANKRGEYSGVNDLI